MLLYPTNGVFFLNNAKCKGKLILDYISGNDLKGYNIEELEDNPAFMADVMELTMDKEMYYSCSDTVKKNINFIKRIITKFKNDSEFIIKVADQYINDSNNDKISKEEINILMGYILNETSNFDLIKYKLEARVFYEKVILEIATILSTLDEKEQKQVGKGFYFIEECYMENSLITNYFASNMIEEIFFYDTEYKLEELLHMHFRKKEDLEKYGEVNFLVTYIGSIDPFLSDYVSKNPGLISNIKKSIAIVKGRWQNYIDRMDNERIEMIWDEMYHYQENHLSFYKIDYEKCLGDIMTKLGMEKLFKDYKRLQDESYPNFKYEDILEYDEDSSNEFIPENFSIIEKEQFIRHMTTYIKDLFKYDIIPDEEKLKSYDQENANEEQNKGEIIRVDFKKGKAIKK